MVIYISLFLCCISAYFKDLIHASLCTLNPLLFIAAWYPTEHPDCSQLSNTTELCNNHYGPVWEILGEVDPGVGIAEKEHVCIHNPLISARLISTMRAPVWGVGSGAEGPVWLTATLLVSCVTQESYITSLSPILSFIKREQFTVPSS